MNMASNRVRPSWELPGARRRDRHPVLVFACCQGGDPNPLSPLDTSSPRATLRGIHRDGRRYLRRGMADIIEEYARSDSALPDRRPASETDRAGFRRAPKAI